MEQVGQADPWIMRFKVVTAAQAYKKGLSELESMVRATEREVINESGHALLVTDNINFFTKSFIISTCAHLEMCIKDVVFAVAADLDERLSVASVPSSIVEWRYNQKKHNAPGTGSHRLGIGMTRKEVDDLVSGNVYKTKDALALVGVNLAADGAKWEGWKELIQNMVTRRNNIVHHNDDASDLSLGDIRQYIASTVAYIEFIVAACEATDKNKS